MPPEAEEQEQEQQEQEEEEFTPPKDGSWIPKTRFDEARADDQRKLATLQNELQKEREDRIRAEERAKAEKPKVLSRAELNQLVADGSLTEDARDEYLEKQREERIEQRLEAKFAAERKQSDRISLINAQMERYKTLIPDVMVAGSEPRARVESEFNFLVSVDGQPQSNEEALALELKALRAAFGPVDRLKETTRKRRETHQETGGGAADEGGPKEDTAPSKLTARERDHYQRLIDSGVYTGWKQVREEQKFKKK
jgi:hypothetical protein